MVTICQISQVNYGEYDEVWAIVRSLKYGNPRIRHVPELSPSWGLFEMYMRLKKDGNWNEDKFRRLYVPQFLKEMRGKEQQKLMNELFATKKRICLVCFCQEEELCHRSIIGGMLQGAGLEVRGLSRDYSHYYEWYKNGVPGLSDKVSITDGEMAGKRAADYNGNVTYLYKTAEPILFKDGIPAMFFTGRRPKDLCGYETMKYKGFVCDLADMVYREFYVKLGIRRFITGGAQGFDQMAFWAVERMKTYYGCSDIQNVVFMPFEGQEARWAEKGCFSIAEYRQMVKHADMVVVVCEDNAIESMFIRNHAMCDNSCCGLALYPDDTWKENRGGTSECMRYAVESPATLYRLGYAIDGAGLHIGTMTAA